ncbi:MAG: asparaginase [Deltaproteobacteria bacterium]|nr:asparaginase [Deltaproteobacteria bacterium]
MVTIGCTLAMDSSAPGKAVSPLLSGEDLVGAVPGLAGIVNLQLENRHPIPSGHLQWNDLLTLSQRISDICRGDPDGGVVVTTGTDTLEEAAYFVDLTLELENCVVFTGALRDPTQIGPDGPRNLKDAVTVAASTVCRRLGVLTCLNAEIHAARDVTKMNTTDVSSFTSPKLGLLGVVHGEKVVMRRKPWTHEYIKTDRVAERIELIKCVVGDEGRMMRAMTELGVEGFVIEGFGGGQVPPGLRDAIAEAMERDIPVIMTSRCLWGELLVDTYDYLGSEIDLRELGVLFIGCMSGPKARIKLALALASDSQGAPLATYFPD